MLIGSFEVNDTIGSLRDPIAVATLRPWLDAGNAGSLTLRRLEDSLGARELGQLARPGDFFDFTRYRPTVRYNGDEREFVLPNTRLMAARRPSGRDLLLLDALEPHARAEDYIDSIAELLQSAGVKVHWRLGAWFGGVPHTRPLSVTTSVGQTQVDAKTGRPIRRATRYEGPTSIMNLLSARLEALGIENNSLTLQLPHYLPLEEDFSGAAALLEAAGSALGAASELEASVLGLRARGEHQYERLSHMVAADGQLTRVVEELERVYDDGRADRPQEGTTLSPEIEGFLRDVGRGFDSGASEI